MIYHGDVVYLNFAWRCLSIALSYEGSAVVLVKAFLQTDTYATSESVWDLGCHSLGHLTSHPLNWPSFGKGENKSQLIDIVSPPHQTMFQYTDTTL